MLQPPPTSDRLGRTLAVAAATVLATAAVVAAFLGLGMLVEAPFEVFSRDAADVLDGPFYTAYLSELVSLVWNLSAAIALFSSAVLHRAGHTDGFRLLAVGGMVTAAMALDDLLLLHENVYPAAGIPERASYAVYGILVVAFAAGFRRRLGTAVLLIAAALVMWVVSAGVDLTIGGRQASFVVEDGTKAVGVALWSVMLVRRAWAEMRLALSAAHEPRQRGAAPRPALPSGPP